jgi:hypothetical protein
MKRLHHQWFVDVGGSLDVAQRESFNVGEEDCAVSEVEASAASAEPCVRVSAASLAVFWASAAPGSEVCAVDACGLDEAHGGQGLTRPEAEGFPSEPGLDDPEALTNDRAP